MDSRNKWPSGPDHSSSSPSLKRSRQSSPPTTTSSRIGPSSSPISSTRSRSDQTSLRPGSADDAGDMYRSPTPTGAAASSAVKYTRTGRVSKATKGQRVHHCDECGKTYTRAEHLRRHQQNHNPGAYACDFPGCRRAFYREDLLARHRVRHNDPDNPSSRRNSVDSQVSAQSIVEPTQALTSSSTVPSAIFAPLTSSTEPQNAAVAGSAQRSSATVYKRIIPPNELRSSISSICVDEESCGNEHNASFLSSPYPVPISSGTPPQFDFSNGANYQLPRYDRAWAPDYLWEGYGPPACSIQSSGYSGSPSTLQRHGNRPRDHARNNICVDGAYNQDSSTSLGFTNQLAFTSPYEPAQMFAAAARDRLELTALTIPGTDLDLNMDFLLAPTQQRYVSAYWTDVHPLFPVIHRGTFEASPPSPLLKTAVLALGAQSLGEIKDSLDSRILHERCVKVLRRRASQQYQPFRICDLQATVLIEIYAVFKARQPSLQFSRSFEQVYNQLLHDPELSVRSFPTPSTINYLDYYGSLASMYPSSLDVPCKQRILLACQLLDLQHSALFGRQPLNDVSAAFCNIPLPETQSSWDSLPNSNATSIEGLTRTVDDNICDLLRDASCLKSSMPQPHDSFVSSMMIATIIRPSLGAHVGGAHLEDDDGIESPLLHATEQNPRSAMAYHTAMLCKQAPIRDILAVAGESWVMTEKLSTQAELVAAQMVVRNWASESSGSGVKHDALAHAFAILQVHHKHPKIGLLYRDWAIYLAAITIWAKTYATAYDHRPAKRVKTSSQQPPACLGSQDSESAITNLLKIGPNGLSSWPDAQKVLLWTKSRLDRVNMPHSSGLISLASDVLEKLGTRGNEPHWF